MGKRVVITSLAMRFYVSDGWTKEELKKYLIRGHLSEVHLDKWDHYFRLDPNSQLDVDQMFKDGAVGEVVGKEDYGETRTMTDIEAMKDRNW